MRAVVLLTAVMMVVEIAVGYASGSMALIADGWHMATHVGALGLANLAYGLSRKFAADEAFAFGTGKVQVLAGFTSAIVLGVVAVAMIVESVSRLVRPEVIDFASSLPVAVVGLGVNLLSMRILHAHDDHHEGHDRADHDHNHRAAVVHVAADALTSGLAITALLAGRWLGLSWLDPVTGIVGGVVVLAWGVDLCRRAGGELIDLEPERGLAARVRETLEQIDDVRVRDLHIWPLGHGRRSCVVSIECSQPRETRLYRERILARVELTHLTVEVLRCEGHDAHASA